MRAFAVLLAFFTTNYLLAAEVAECKGTCAIDGSPVVARITNDGGIGQVVMTTNVDTVESATKIDLSDGGKLRVYDNSFQMDFTVSPTSPASPVEAFRDGEFFVEDFVCSTTQAETSPPPPAP